MSSWRASGDGWFAQVDGWDYAVWRESPGFVAWVRAGGAWRNLCLWAAYPDHRSAMILASGWHAELMLQDAAARLRIAIGGIFSDQDAVARWHAAVRAKLVFGTDEARVRVAA